MVVDDTLNVKEEDTKNTQITLGPKDCHESNPPALEEECFLNGALINMSFVNYAEELKFKKYRKEFANFGLVNLSGRTLIVKPAVNQGRETFEFSTPHDFHEFHAADSFRVSEATPRGSVERSKSFSEFWLKSTELCKRYKSVDFDLSPDFSNPEVFNLWNGFIEPVVGDADPFINHIESLLVNESGTYQEAHYLIKLMAWVVQNPHLAAEILALLIGPQGAGKTTVTDILSRLCPANTATTSNLDNFMKWNGATANCKFIGLEEAFSNGNYLVRQQLKNAITSKWREIECKGKDPFYVRNVVFYIGTSNSDRPFSIDHDDRRTAVFRTKIAGDKAYFDLFYDWLDSQGGSGIVLSFLKNLDLTGFNRKDIPNTAARAALKVNSLSSDDSFILNLLSNAYDEQLNIRNWDSSVSIDRTQVYELYRSCSKHAVDIRQFSALLAKIFEFQKGWADAWRSNGSSSRARTSYYKIPKLEEARTSFAKYLKSSVNNIFNN